MEDDSPLSKGLVVAEVPFRKRWGENRILVLFSFRTEFLTMFKQGSQTNKQKKPSLILQVNVLPK